LKGTISASLYVAAIVLAFVSPWLSYAIYVIVAAMWLVPDRRIESQLAQAK
jgi:TMEM175 potassium channel family protein